MAQGPIEIHDIDDPRVPPEEVSRLFADDQFSVRLDQALASPKSSESTLFERTVDQIKNFFK